MHSLSPLAASIKLTDEDPKDDNTKLGHEDGPS